MGAGARRASSGDRPTLRARRVRVQARSWRAFRRSREGASGCSNMWLWRSTVAAGVIRFASRRLSSASRSGAWPRAWAARIGPHVAHVASPSRFIFARSAWAHWRRSWLMRSHEAGGRSRSPSGSRPSKRGARAKALRPLQMARGARAKEGRAGKNHRKNRPEKTLIVSRVSKRAWARRPSGVLNRAIRACRGPWELPAAARRARAGAVSHAIERYSVKPLVSVYSNPKRRTKITRASAHRSRREGCRTSVRRGRGRPVSSGGVFGSYSLPSSLKPPTFKTHSKAAHSQAHR